MAERYDVVVLGAGPAGYVAAIRSAQLGLSVACVDRWRTPSGEYALGGTCLHVGCIPSKALLESSEHYERARHRLAAHGVSVGEVSFDLAVMQARKEAIVRRMGRGIAALFRKHGVAWIPGHGRFVAGGTTWKLAVTGEGGTRELEATHVIVATGSTARRLPDVEVDNRIVCDNEGGLAFERVPERLGVIGAGVIGLELGSVWRRLGARVTLLEALPTFLPAADESVAQEAWRLFTGAQGLHIELGVRVESVVRSREAATVRYRRADGSAAELACDRLIVAVGRQPASEGLGAEAVGLAIDAQGFIEVDKNCRSNLPRVYAIGDVVRGPMLAHKGEEEGIMVAEIIAGQHGHVNYDAIPWVMYTMPEIAWVGATEQELRTQGIAYRAGRFPFAYNGRALGRDDVEGFVKILADAVTDRILGVHAIGALASELIAEAVLAIEFGASSEDLGRICHAHPSMSEVMREAALALAGRSLNG